MSTFLHIYRDLFAYGKPASPRNQEILELQNAQYTFAPYERCSSFEARNFNLEYAKQEFAWYVRADPFDSSIEKYADAWKKLKQPDGRYLSNYGQYIFGSSPRFLDSPWMTCVRTLVDDPDSRRACITLLKPEHIFAENVDVVCTYAISFRIRNGKLNMSVSMRSNDAIFGLTNDVFCFSLLHESMLRYVNFYAESEHELGEYVHKADSLHVYSRHFEMLELLCSDGMRGYYEVHIPKIKKDDLYRFRISETPFPCSEFTEWFGVDHSRTSRNV